MHAIQLHHAILIMKLKRGIMTTSVSCQDRGVLAPLSWQGMHVQYWSSPATHFRGGCALSSRWRAPLALLDASWEVGSPGSRPFQNRSCVLSTTGMYLWPLSCCRWFRGCAEQPSGEGCFCRWLLCACCCPGVGGAGRGYTCRLAPQGPSAAGVC